MSSYADRLKALREQLKADRLDGFVVPLTDEHMSEYVGSYAQRLAWLTGFKGSAGSAVVLPEEAAIFVDGRYTLQVRQQVSPTEWSYQSVPETSAADWLKDHAPEGARIGYDPWLHTRDWVKKAARRWPAAAPSWSRSSRTRSTSSGTTGPKPRTRTSSSSPTLAGKSAAEKRTEIGDWLANNHADAAVLSALDSIAWAFNVRGADVSHTPVALAYALVHADGTADLFVASEKVGPDVRQHLGNGVRLHERSEFEGALGQAQRSHCRGRSRARRRRDLRRAGARGRQDCDFARPDHPAQGDQEFRRDRRPESRPGARRRGDLEDSCAGSRPRLRAARSTSSPRRTSSKSLRRENPEIRDLSFDTISGAGPNGAIVHYKSSEKTNRKLEKGTLYLVDSGGQYVDGTTDITRTVAVGEPTEEMRDRFTRVLMGHISLATAVFPKGTRGSQLDSFARRPLWEAGLDYAHGTGHGVGSFLAVHEGPQRISPVGSSQSGGDEPLQAGMILSNEPGYYKTGEYGIRIENLVLVVPREIEGAEKEMLGFETLTFAPIDRRLIDAGMLSGEELGWLNCYHAHVLAKIGPRLSGDDLAWLQRACAPIGEEG